MFLGPELFSSNRTERSARHEQQNSSSFHPSVSLCISFLLRPCQGNDGIEMISLPQISLRSLSTLSFSVSQSDGEQNGNSESNASFPSLSAFSYTIRGDERNLFTILCSKTKNISRIATHSLFILLRTPHLLSDSSSRDACFDLEIPREEESDGERVERAEMRW